jgi:hypothetical protein
MQRPDPVAGDEIRQTIDEETALVMSAVDLVASGGASSASVVGLRLGEAVLAIVRPLAGERGLRLEPLWGPDEAGLDIRVVREPA